MITHILATYSDYEQRRKAKAADAAWERDDGATNYGLKDGQRVVLVSSTVADTNTGSVLLGAYSEGVVAIARAPRVMRPKVRKPRTYLHFANVDFEGPSGLIRARVPHNALKVLR